MSEDYNGGESHNGELMEYGGRELQTIPAVPIQRVQTQYTSAIAVQNPRDLKTVEARALTEAAMLGADAYYGWGAGQDKIEGPSKGLAMMLARVWGNCAVDLKDMQETPDAWIFTAVFVDLETGFTLPRQFRQAKKWQVFGKFDQARKDDIRFQIGQSKAIRNVILNAMPEWLVRRALDRAKGGVREKIEKSVAQYGLPAVVGKALSKLADLQVPEARVLQSMGRSAAGAITVEDLVILHGNIAALEAKAETIDALFPVKNPDATPDKSASETLEALRSKAKATEAAETPKPADESPVETKGIGSAGAEPPEGVLTGMRPGGKSKTRN